MQWKARYNKAVEEAVARRRHNRKVPADLAQPRKGPQAVYRGLKKHESSMLIQIRTGKLGLNTFLHRQGVPGVASPACECGTGAHTAAHFTLDCPFTSRAREDL